MLALPWRNHSTLVVNGRQVDLEEGESVVGFDSTGSILWDASQTLLDWIIEHRDLDLSVVLELGGGTGALSIALAWAGAGKIVCTDLEHALPLLRRNVAKNNVSEIVSVAALVLGNEAPRIGATLVIASDVVYSSAMIGPLCATVRSVFSEATTTTTAVLLCNKIRSNSLIHELEAALPVPFKAHVVGDHVVHELRASF